MSHALAATGRPSALATAPAAIEVATEGRCEGASNVNATGRPSALATSPEIEGRTRHSHHGDQRLLAAPGSDTEPAAAEMSTSTCACTTCAAVEMSTSTTSAARIRAAYTTAATSRHEAAASAARVQGTGCRVQAAASAARARSAIPAFPSPSGTTSGSGGPGAVGSVPSPSVTTSGAPPPGAVGSTEALPQPSQAHVDITAAAAATAPRARPGACMPAPCALYRHCMYPAPCTLYRHACALYRPSSSASRFPRRRCCGRARGGARGHHGPCSCLSTRGRAGVQSAAKDGSVSCAQSATRRLSSPNPHTSPNYFAR